MSVMVCYIVMPLRRCRLNLLTMVERGRGVQNLTPIQLFCNNDEVRNTLNLQFSVSFYASTHALQKSAGHVTSMTSLILLFGTKT